MIDRYLDQMIKHFFEIFDVAIMEGVHTLGALLGSISQTAKTIFCQTVPGDILRTGTLTGNLHFVSQSALMDS